MAKVFLAFFNGLIGVQNKYALPVFYEAFINGLIQNGNEVFACMHNHFGGLNSSIPVKLLSAIKEFNPDLIILFNNHFYDISKDFECPIIIYEVDSPLYYGNTATIKNSPERYKFFVASSSSIDILINSFNISSKNILHIPFFTSIKAENIEKTHNICFIGTKFKKIYKYCYNKFMELYPTDEERHEFLDLINTLQNNVFIKPEVLLASTKSEKILKTFNLNEIIFLLSDYRRIKILSSVADLGLDIWGTPNWGTDYYNEPWLVLNFHNDKVYSIKHNQDIYNSSKIGINIGHLQAKDGFPWRVFDIMASNACLVSEYHGDFAKYIPNIKLPFYANAWEAREQCKKILNNENYRLDIVAQCQDIINKKYRFDNILILMQDFLNTKLCNKKMKNILETGISIEGENASAYLTNLNEWFEIPKAIKENKNKKMNIKNRIRYKIWSHYNKILKQKGII